ncbi:hypothetical protein J3R03_003371 [Actinoplanes couchii]|nr:hypothetical protein [Actinoplanes couchii]
MRICSRRPGSFSSEGGRVRISDRAMAELREIFGIGDR